MGLWDTEREREKFDSKQADTGQECPQCHLMLAMLASSQLLHRHQKLHCVRVSIVADKSLDTKNQSQSLTMATP